MKQLKLRNAFCGVLGAIIYNYAPAALAQTETQVPTSSGTPPTLTAIQPVNPVASNSGGPVITAITAHLPPQTGAGIVNMIVPEFHFTAPNGNAVLLHLEILESTSQTDNRNFNPTAPINIPADAQKRGAVLSGGWGCGTAQFHTTVRAYIMDADGNRSNAVQYTVHCNGG